MQTGARETLSCSLIDIRQTLVPEGLMIGTTNQAVGVLAQQNHDTPGKRAGPPPPAMDNESLILPMVVQHVTALEDAGPAGQSREAMLALVAVLCGANWQTPQQREEAQRLVARLDRLLHPRMNGNVGEAERPRKPPRISSAPPPRRKTST
jgi:hypothetical protein